MEHAMTNALVEAAHSPEMLTAAEIRARVNRIQEIMQAVMKKDVHYGVIPGTGDKPTLYKAGAEKILMTFRIAAQMASIEDLSTEDAVRYRVTVRGVNAAGEILGEGAGECSSGEEKYKWRRPVHDNEYQAAPEDRRREKFQRDGGVWRQVRTEPADVANTVLKMAAKRALVAMTLVVTAASDVFSQDIEDLPDELRDVATGENGGGRAEPANVRRSAGQAGTGPLPDGVVRIVKIEESKGTSKKTGKPFTKFTIVDSRGGRYSTFSESLAEHAGKCRDARTPVTLTYESGQYGDDLKEITVWTPPAATQAAQEQTHSADAPVSREPGEDDE
jgi:hypothetical protein